MALIKTKISKILSKTKREFEYYRGLDFKNKLIGTEWIVEILTEKGKTYKIRLRGDGRRVNTFYEGKEIWGIENNFVGIDYWWWTKKKFEEMREIHIQRTKEYIKSEQAELKRLESL